MSDSRASAPPNVSPKVVIEYPLPGAKETHEVVAPAPGLLLISQQTDGTILKVALDPTARRPASVLKSVVTTPWSGLHGLSLSTAYPGMVWATLQFESALVLLDPDVDKPDCPPRILDRISIPAPGHGPHVVVEDGANLWVSCKDSGHVVRISHASYDYEVWPTSPRPVFVAVHPTSGDVYAGLDKSSRIFRLEVKSGATSEMAIDPAIGSTPVGMLRGADGNVWFVLLGDKTGGTGAFGRIGADGAITWFHLGNMAGMRAGLIHLGFGEPEGENPATLYLLGSTMGSMMALDAVFEVTFDPGYTRIATVQTVAMATPMCMTHRVLPMGGDVFVTAMVCALTHVTPSGSVGTEIADYFADFGVGQPAQRLVYTDPGA